MIRATLWMAAAAIALLAAGAQALPGDESLRSKVATESCFFAPAVSSDPMFNFVYADSNAVYQCSSYDLPAGAQLTLKGEYPRARSLSWTVYGGQGGDQITDTAIQPDPGSINPFIYGNDRFTKNRSYTLHVVSGNRPANPADRAPNTIYHGGPTPGRFGNFICGRIYVPDFGTEPFGNTELPDVSLTLSDGTVLEGAPMCQAVDALNKGFAVNATSIGFNLQTYLTNREGPAGSPRPPTHPATNPPVFRAFFTTAHQTCSFFTPEQNCGTPVYNPDGVGLGNPSNRYVETWVDRGHGDVLVLRAKKPTTPTTWKGSRRFVPDRDYDLRYYSICPQESLATWRVGDCIFDEELPADEDGFYTLVLSKPSFRPKNATKECGVAWATPPPAGDGAGDLFLYDIWIRFQLPSPNFEEAAQNVLTPGTEEAVMGDYYPRGTYMSKEEFEALGCPGEDD